MSIIDFEAARKWNKISKDLQYRLINNVFCPNCFETTIVDYSIKSGDGGITLEGKCKKCDRDVARFIEDEE